ncbi:MAG: nitroreductase [Rhodospirillaceae bacterium]|jgi:nitroreductase|nr:nitroreductase [Rhodospirillaceae bacterium]MBT4045265.1 nitroreductase [Rhodospirillaceae bacterium]MBT4686509.1 nitroreductase [Rhodospirillaceae bacterium]MBT5082651.1 nitroreductase [Rhodospirillaceae bacterium]MBT5524185.1 nitroreductase [Rhodospirillaceae bacterium]
MNVHEAIMSRRSVRKFLPTPVPKDSLRRIIEGAGMAPSGHNIQPWKLYVIGGATKDAMSAEILDAIANGDAKDHQPEYPYYPTNWFEPFKTRRRETGFGLYAALGIGRDDMAAREAQMNRNFEFFDAPIGMFVAFHRELATGTFMDMGMFIENILIGARGEGLHTCGQAAFTWYHKIIRHHLKMGDEELLACGIALGFEDTTAAENKFRVEKLVIEDFTTFMDVE